MGLAAPKKRRKLAHDPNNTAWSRDTTTYGQRILAQQGWKPGNYLGAHSAAHASHYTAGSAGHVRVALKDDNLGLGASQAAKTEATGLGNFQDLLGRLNGRDPAKIAQEQTERKVLGIKMYAQQRWGTTRFVRAGYLVGDKIEARPPAAATAVTRGSVSKYDQEVATVGDMSTAQPPGTSAKDDHQVAEKALRKEEKRRQKEQRRAERRQRRERKQAKQAARDALKQDSPDNVARQDLAPMPVRRNVRERFLAQKRKSAMDPRALNEILMIKSSG